MSNGCGECGKFKKKMPYTLDQCRVCWKSFHVGNGRSSETGKQIAKINDDEKPLYAIITTCWCNTRIKLIWNGLSWYNEEPCINNPLKVNLFKFDKNFKLKLECDNVVSKYADYISYNPLTIRFNHMELKSDCCSDSVSTLIQTF